jgi:hypothetical protein
MAFLTGAIDRKNLARFKRLIRTSRIAELHQKPLRREDYYVVELRISMDPETIIRVLEKFNARTYSARKTKDGPAILSLLPQETYP